MNDFIDEQKVAEDSLIKQVTIWGTIIVVLLVAVVSSLVEPMTKDVYISNTTGNCVKVINYAGETPKVEICGDLPRRYNVVRVK